MLELALRLVFSLAVVIGLLLVIARIGARRFRGGNDALVQVVHRQPLSRSSAVAVVTVGSRVLVLGTTEQQISVLTELDPEELETGDLELGGVLELAEGTDPLAPSITQPVTQPVIQPGAHRADRPVAARTVSPSAQAAHNALTGSVLSPDTWRQALAAATRRAS